MSHQTGIQSNESLRQYFTKCKTGNIRLLKVNIDNEELVPGGHYDAKKSSWEKEFESVMSKSVEDNKPCYLLFRLDSKNSSGYEWLLISWCPDTSHIREKMLYASTKATLKLEFGTAHIADELHATTKSDITLDGYLKYCQSVKEPTPLTSREEELQEIRQSEINTDINVDSRHQTLGGVQFPIAEAAKQAVKDMVAGSYNYIQFRIDIEEEKIYLVTAENIQVDQLPLKVPDTNARYHMFKFDHSHEGDYLESFVFIYSMPGYKCSIKERMLYSSSKGPLTDTISSWGIDFAKKLEIDSGSELTKEFLYEEIHPTKNLHRPKFEKPKGPANRGPKRMTKTKA